MTLSLAQAARGLYARLRRMNSDDAHIVYALEEQREALLESLEWALPRVNMHGQTAAADLAYQRARAAITKAKKGSV